jgi:hypothetical protein
MKSEIKERWLKALRSGEYKQGTDRLYSLDGSFCCLGVLADIFIREMGGKWKWEKDDHYVHYIFSGCYKDIYLLPMEVREWAGKIENEKRLATLNDSGSTFEEIAKVIEKEL